MSNDLASDVAFWANVCAPIALVLNAIALFVAAWQLWIGRGGTSASALISLNESFRQAWLQFSKANEDTEKQYAFSDVMNVIETACAIYKDRLFVGQSGKLLEDYLCHVFILIRESNDARTRIEKMFVTSKTFEHALSFLINHRSEIRGIRLPAHPTS